MAHWGTKGPQMLSSVGQHTTSKIDDNHRKKESWPQKQVMSDKRTGAEADSESHRDIKR